jgi:hypothetical protein
MPIEIKELHIKVSVTSQQSGKTSTNIEQSGSGASSPRDNEKEEIGAACIEKVMEIIKNKNER